MSATGNPGVDLVVNGAPRQVPAGSSLTDLLSALQVDSRTVAVEHNRVVVHDRQSFSKIRLNAGDTIEIVHFVGGG